MENINDEFDIDLNDFLIDFVLNEIALEGLDGCEINNLFNLLFKSSKKLIENQNDLIQLNETESTLNKLIKLNKLFQKCIQSDLNVNYIKNFIWKLLINQFDLNFYLLNKEDYLKESKQTPSKLKSFNKSLNLSKTTNTQFDSIQNDKETNQRGFCSSYSKRKLINDLLKPSDLDDDNDDVQFTYKCYDTCLNEFKNNNQLLFIVASQQFRNKTLCPSFKNLDFENLNNLEYCVLESIAKSRFDGVYSTGENGLVQMFDIVPKQLHYILVILESHQLIKKQVLTSEKKRSIIHLSRFAFRKKTVLENLCDYLIRKNKNTNNSGYFDTCANLKRVLKQSNKQFKTLIQSAEKQNIVQRYFNTYEAKFKKNKNSNKFYTAQRQIRMIKLTDSYVKNLKQSIQDDYLDDDLDDDDQNNNIENSSNLTNIIDLIGKEQSNMTSLYTQIFDKIEQCGKDGISIRHLGNLFGFDFYKSRRMGSNLQSHPSIVTMIKETNRGKSKYQTIFMRKFLNTDNTCEKLESKSPNTTVLNEELNETNNESNLSIIKKDGQTNKNIQGLMSNRALMRKKLVQDYIDKNKICTKFELTREIRNYETQLGLKGSIDSKTTKRMLISMENESKLKIFNANLKNLSYMCVRSIDLSENDELYKNYCSNFKRTFDTVDLKKQNDDETSLNESNISSLNESSNLINSDNLETSFTLTRSFISSVVEKLNFSTNYSKVYALVPKFQKAIILHRFLNYIKFFYDGKPQSINKFDTIPNLKPEQEEYLKQLNEIDLNVVKSCQLPNLNNVYQPINLDNSLAWNSFIPPMLKQDKNLNCIFIGDIFSHMPLSVFCSIIVINHQVPGLVALLKHPQKRHLLVKDLPPNLIAPLIFERRYLQRILAILQLLACLGLVSFVDSNFSHSLNRDIQSQMVYIHRKAMFYDTTKNKCKDWNELKELNKNNIDLNENDNLIYEKCLFEFNTSNDLIEYWRKLLHVSMNTYKFSVGKYLHESKRLRQELLNKIVQKYKLNQVKDLWSIENYGDHMGPGLYDSQLFLNSFKNWMISPSNLNTNLNTSERPRNNNRIEPAITKEADQSFAPYSELALYFPFGVYRGIASSTSLASNESKTRRQNSNIKLASKRKLDNVDIEKQKPEFKFKRTKKSTTTTSTTTTTTTTDLKLIKTAKYLVDKAKYNFNLSNKQSSLNTASSLTSLNNKQSNTNSNIQNDRRANWNSTEDEMILLIKVTALYFLPNEKSVPFKLISDIMNELMPKNCLDKRISSFGRRIKILMKNKMNFLFVCNKLELCKQDKELEKKYAHEKFKIKRNLVDKDLVDLYINFIKDLKEKYLKKRVYSLETIDSSNNLLSENKQDEENTISVDLPGTIEEFNKKYKILNTQKDFLIKNQNLYYQQPKTDYEITSNTLHSAIHSSILINDKNPRVFESFNLFDKYSDQLLTEVINKMSSQHKIIAPTKYSELKKKNVTAFSKHIGKAYHISQRYQYKWINNISSNVLNETKMFKDDLVKFKMNSNSNEDMFDCTDRDDMGMTSFLAHTIDNSDIQVQIDVPNKIWVSKII